MPPYLLWIFLFVLLPLVVVWLLNMSVLKRSFRVFLFVLLSANVVSVPWDFIALSNHIWYYPENSTLGIAFHGFPLEEFLFLVLMNALFASLTIVLATQKQKTS